MINKTEMAYYSAALADIRELRNIIRELIRNMASIYGPEILWSRYYATSDQMIHIRIMYGSTWEQCKKAMEAEDIKSGYIDNRTRHRMIAIENRKESNRDADRSSIPQEN